MCKYTYYVCKSKQIKFTALADVLQNLKKPKTKITKTNIKSL